MNPRTGSRARFVALLVVVLACLAAIAWLTADAGRQRSARPDDGTTAQAFDGRHGAATTDVGDADPKEAARRQVVDDARDDPREGSEGPLLAAGRTVDSTGSALPGVEVELVPYSEDDFHMGTRSFRRHDAVRSRSGPDGRFVIHGAVDGPFELLAELEEYVMTHEVLLEDLGEPVLVVLTRAGRIRLTLTPGSREGFRRLRWEIRRPGENHDLQHITPPILADEEWRDDLVPGTYDVVLIGETPQPLWRIDGVVVPAGGEATDPRLRGVDPNVA